MQSNEILTLISIGVTGIVGIVLYNQIKAQKTIIDKYKGLVEAISPDKIISLHEREVNKIKETMNTDIKELRTQIIELGIYVDHDLNKIQEMALSVNQAELFDDNDRIALINRNMPHCAGVLGKIHEFRKSANQ